ncbi:MAG: PIN domain-containing protein, partial [Pseudomonadota bacterium]
YLFGDDDRKRVIASDLLAEGGGASVQLLNEVAYVVRRKLKWDWGRASATLTDFEALLDIAPLTLAASQRARRISADTGYSIYDALMLAVALENGATTFLSEDLQHGRVVEGMEIRNPFS